MRSCGSNRLGYLAKFNVIPKGRTGCMDDERWRGGTTHNELVGHLAKVAMVATAKGANAMKAA